MALVTVVSVLSASFPAIAQEIEENNAVLVSEKVSAMCEKYDTETDELTEDTETKQRTVEERLIVKRIHGSIPMKPLNPYTAWVMHSFSLKTMRTRTPLLRPIKSRATPFSMIPFFHWMK